MPFLEFGPLELSWLDSCHIMGDFLAHSFFHRQQAHRIFENCIPILVRADYLVWGFTLAASAYLTIFPWVSLAANWTKPYGMHWRMAYETFLYCDWRNHAKGISGIFNFGFKPCAVLLPFWFLFKKPCI